MLLQFADFLLQGFHFRFCSLPGELFLSMLPLQFFVLLSEEPNVGLQSNTCKFEKETSENRDEFGHN